jgi:hypothetical protein
MVANKVTKANRFQKRTAAKTAVVKKRWRWKEKNKNKDHGERQHDIGNLCLGH